MRFCEAAAWMERWRTEAGVYGRHLGNADALRPVSVYASTTDRDGEVHDSGSDNCCV